MLLRNHSIANSSLHSLYSIEGAQQVFMDHISIENVDLITHKEGLITLRDIFEFEADDVRIDRVTIEDPESNIF